MIGFFVYTNLIDLVNSAATEGCRVYDRKVCLSNLNLKRAETEPSEVKRSAGLWEPISIVSCFSKKVSYFFDGCFLNIATFLALESWVKATKANIGLPKYNSGIKGNTALKANQSAELLMAI